MVKESRLWHVNQEKEIWKNIDLGELESVIREYDPNYIYDLKNICT